jgi:hypothetical protein
LTLRICREAIAYIILPQVKQAVGVSAMKKKAPKRPKRRIPLPKKTEKVHDEKVGYRRKPKHPKRDDSNP